MSNDVKNESLYSEEEIEYIETPATEPPAPESTQYGVRSTAVSDD